MDQSNHATRTFAASHCRPSTTISESSFISQPPRSTAPVLRNRTCCIAPRGFGVIARASSAMAAASITPCSCITRRYCSAPAFTGPLRGFPHQPADIAPIAVPHPHARRAVACVLHPDRAEPVESFCGAQAHALGRAVWPRAVSAHGCQEIAAHAPTARIAEGMIFAAHHDLDRPMSARRADRERVCRWQRPTLLHRLRPAGDRAMLNSGRSDCTSPSRWIP